VCSRCRRPATVCYCRHLPSLETVTRVVVLQHPRERNVAIGTARMAALCLPNAEIHIGVRFGGSVALARALSDPERPAVLLYPGEGAIDVVSHPPAGPVTLVVVDGTWWQTKKLVRENPELAALPRYAFTPPSPSEYRIRKEPNDACTSTIEALVHVLGALEGDPLRFRSMLDPFRAMVDAQVACQVGLRAGRVQKRRARPPRGLPRVPDILVDRAGDLVCVVGEANAWPYRSAEKSSLYPDEIVQWTARRVATGETIDLVIAPRHPLAPSTTSHTGLSAEILGRGGSMPAELARWRAFVRDTDVVCAWGHYGAQLFAAAGGYLPPARIDLRQVSRDFAQGKVGTLEDFAARIAPHLEASPGGGRGALRLGLLTAIARHFSSAGRGLERSVAS
jgi:tRNA-uridine aminocarboxypropyltransferase